MRPAVLAIATVLLFSAASHGQAPQSREEPKLDELLGGWEKALASLHSLAMECERTTKDKVFQSTEVFRGTAKIARPTQPNQAMRASLEMFKEVDGKLQPDRFEKYIFTGSALYEFAPGDKVIRKHVLPQPKSGLGDQDIVSFLFGNKTSSVLERYRLSLEPARDKYYFLVKVEPKHERDKADFTVAYVALYRSNYLTAMVHFRQPNGNEVTWQFRKLQPNAAVKDTDFAAPEPPPAGWQLQRVAAPDRKTP